MPKVKSTPTSRIRAKRTIYRRFSPRTSRAIAKQFKRIASLGTARNYEQSLAGYLAWAEERRISPSAFGALANLSEFLSQIAQDHSQSSVDQYRQALGIAFNCQIPAIRTAVKPKKITRAYRISEAHLIIAALNDRDAISACLCLFSGLRVQETATICRAEEAQASPRRPWTDDRFAGLPYKYARYIVTGKGGLRREVAVPCVLIPQLEACRRPEPTTVRSRKINYESRYAIGHGQQLSMAITRASRRVLGWSTGAHGLRHAYAKTRLAALNTHFKDFNRAALALSQELGHFRPDITWAYL